LKSMRLSVLILSSIGFILSSTSRLWVGHDWGESLGERWGYEVWLKRILFSAWTFNQA
jgi:hypothetical protein